MSNTNNSRSARNTDTAPVGGNVPVIVEGVIVPAAAPLSPVAVLLANGFAAETIATMTAETIAALTATAAPAAAPVAAVVSFDPTNSIKTQTANAATWYAVAFGVGNLSGIIGAADKYSAYRRALAIKDTLKGQGVKFAGSGKTYVWEGMDSPGFVGADSAKVYYMSAAQLAEFCAAHPALCAALDNAPAAAPDTWDKTFNLSYAAIMAAAAPATAPDAPADNAPKAEGPAAAK